jgi:histidyl-tRNA synthetase
MRDILPEQMLKRQYVTDVIRVVFEEFGFEPLQTPSIELSETLTGKYGEDAERLIFKTWYGDEANADLSLRYDLSVPLCRVVGMYPDLPRPFKRYQIAPVWRADRPQKGRYREFYQCDIDIVGTDSMLADAEIVTVTYETLTRLGFEDLTISINNRKLLDGIGRFAGVPESLLPGLYRSIDKLDKIGLDGVKRELLMVGVPSEPQQPLLRTARLALQGKISLTDLAGELQKADPNSPPLRSEFVDEVARPLAAILQDILTQGFQSSELQAITTRIAGELATPLRKYYTEDSASVIPETVIEKLLDLLQLTGPVMDVLAGLGEKLSGDTKAQQGITELRDLFTYLEAMSIPSSAYELNFAMVRGLEYYTGPIFETIVKKPRVMPSITGGGRYDHLIGMFSPVSYPATGTSLGIERIIDAMDELGMFPPEIGKTTAEVLVAVFSEETVNDSLRLVTLLRQAGIKSILYFDPSARLGEQLGYASSKGIPVAAICGPDEIATNQVTLRKLGSTAQESEQRTVAQSDVVSTIQEWL